jgi:hypothetical protein
VRELIEAIQVLEAYLIEGWQYQFRFGERKDIDFSSGRTLFF